MKNTLSVATFIPILCIMFFFQYSCTEAYSLENARLDSLELHLSTAKENLNLDIELIESRIKEMENYLLFIKNNLHDTVDNQFGLMMDRYKALVKIYKKNRDTYHWCTSEYEALNKQVKDLRTSLNAGNFNREEFKAYYRQEEIDIITLRESSKSIKPSLYEIEPEYIRLSDFVEEEIEKIEGVKSGE